MATAKDLFGIEELGRIEVCVQGRKDSPYLFVSMDPDITTWRTRLAKLETLGMLVVSEDALSVEWPDDENPGEGLPVSDKELASAFADWLFYHTGDLGRIEVRNVAQFSYPTPKDSGALEEMLLELFERHPQAMARLRLDFGPAGVDLFERDTGMVVLGSVEKKS